jgi:ankyrin repeat protein
MGALMDGNPKHSAGRIICLLVCGVDVQFCGGFPPLHMAARYNQPLAARILLGAGSNVETIDRDGKTPLQITEEWEHGHIVELLRKEAQLNFVIFNYSTSFPKNF